MDLTEKEKNVFDLIENEIKNEDLINKAKEKGVGIKSLNMLLISMKKKNVISIEGEKDKRLIKKLN